MLMDACEQGLRGCTHVCTRVALLLVRMSCTNTHLQEPSKKKLKESDATTNGHATPATTTTSSSGASVPPPPPPGPLPRSEPAPPNNILFVENLPKECTEMMLSMLFQQYTGFQQVSHKGGEGCMRRTYHDRVHPVRCCMDAGMLVCTM